MKHKILLSWCSLLGCMVLSQAALFAADGNWESLFNGKDLTGWAPVHDVTFVATNGNLRLVKGMGWLRTEKEYGDFILEFECRALEDKFDSGVFVRAGTEGKPWPNEGWQVNLSYSSFGGFVKGYKTLIPAEAPRPAINKWVKFHIEAKGNKISLTVDGEPNYTFDKADRAKGFIGIQAENKSFDFRDIRVQQLK